MFRQTVVMVVVALAAAGFAGLVHGSEAGSGGVAIRQARSGAEVGLNDDFIGRSPATIAPDPGSGQILASEECEEIGLQAIGFSGIDRVRGNFYWTGVDCALEEFGLCVEFQQAGEAELTFTIHESEDGEVFTKIVEKVVRFEGQPGQPECHLSGPISRTKKPGKPVILKKGFTYILTDGWTDEIRIGYFQDARRQPWPFSCGMVLGAFTLNSPPPLPERIERRPFTGAAHWMKLCFGHCTGNEALKIKCYERRGRTRMVARLRRGLVGASITFRLDGNPNKDIHKNVNERGKAKVKYRNVAPGPHTVEIVQCEVQAKTECP